MIRTSFLEPFRIVTRRVFVLCPLQNGDISEEHTTQIAMLRDVCNFMEDVQPLTFEVPLTLARIFDIRDAIKRSPPDIIRRSLIGAGQAALAAIVLSQFVPFDEVFAFNPEGGGTAFPFELGMIEAREPLEDRFNVIARFDTESGRQLATKVARWADCVHASDDFEAKSSHPVFAALIAQLPSAKPLSLPPDGFIFHRPQAPETLPQ